MVTFTVSIDTALATARIFVGISSDSTKCWEVRGTTAGGETFTLPYSVLARYFKVWGNAQNLPFRFWMW